ncbi:uncharacterized protein LOC125237776 [Leguminivora glycinivorella]|uniref:uncharacterized protein LOC125237776 n=1 Tax=Leguminivora glycinivorella TaxID=1035111 RepID=UPI00200D9EA2|nr:uncharacterized protein LOC125237776 [Leguminivora glycinivorella]
MIKIAFFFFSTVFAKLENPKYDYIFHETFNSLQEVPKLSVPVPSVDAWVLGLNRDVDSLRLRQVSGEEVREVFGRQLNDGPSHRQPRKSKGAKKPSRPILKVDEKAMLAEIMRVINKFALTTHDEAEMNIDDADRGLPSIKLYFKGLHTSLIVRAVGRQWHYIIGPPSLFPEWFYHDHEIQEDEVGPYVDVPKHVTGEFYNALFHLLTMFLSFPV